MVGITASFTLLLGGNGWDVFGAAVVGALLAAFMYAAGRAELNSILKTTAAALAVAVGTLALRQFIWPALNTDLVIIGCIMPLVPGMAFTNALRDIPVSYTHLCSSYPYLLFLLYQLLNFILITFSHRVKHNIFRFWQTITALSDKSMRSD